MTVLADQISRYTMRVVRAEANLNQSQWRVLAAVADKPGRTAAEVTAVTPMDKTIVSRAVNSLLEAGHIEKTSTASDKRRQSLTLTKTGMKNYTRISKILNETLVTSLSTDAEREEFVAALKNFSTKMHERRPKDSKSDT